MHRLCRAGLTCVALLVPRLACAHGDAGEAGGWHYDPLVGNLLLLSVAVQCIGLARSGGARPAIAPRWRIAAIPG